MKHTCIKVGCANTYKSNEPDPYYCATCQEANKALAAKIDAQVAARPKKSRYSAVKEYEEQLKNNPMRAGGMVGIHVKI